MSQLETSTWLIFRNHVGLKPLLIEIWVFFTYFKVSFYCLASDQQE